MLPDSDSGSASSASFTSSLTTRALDPVRVRSPLPEDASKSWVCERTCGSSWVRADFPLSGDAFDRSWNICVWI